MSDCSLGKTAGGQHDQDTGFVRFGYRDYDPLTARFTAKDPIGYAGGDSDVYGYCLDDPVNLVDPKRFNPLISLTSTCSTYPQCG